MADVFSQAAGKSDHARQLAGISSNQLEVGSAEQREKAFFFLSTHYRLAFKDFRPAADFDCTPSCVVPAF